MLLQSFFYFYTYDYITMTKYRAKSNKITDKKSKHPKNAFNIFISYNLFSIYFGIL